MLSSDRMDSLLPYYLNHRVAVQDWRLGLCRWTVLLVLLIVFIIVEALVDQAHLKIVQTSPSAYVFVDLSNSARKNQSTNKGLNDQDLKVVNLPPTSNGAVLDSPIFAEMSTDFKLLDSLMSGLSGVSGRRLVNAEADTELQSLTDSYGGGGSSYGEGSGGSGYGGSGGSSGESGGGSSGGDSSSGTLSSSKFFDLSPSVDYKFVVSHNHDSVKKATNGGILLIRGNENACKLIRDDDRFKDFQVTGYDGKDFDSSVGSNDSISCFVNLPSHKNGGDFFTTRLISTAAGINVGSTVSEESREKGEGGAVVLLKLRYANLVDPRTGAKSYFPKKEAAYFYEVRKENAPTAQNIQVTPVNIGVDNPVVAMTHSYSIRVETVADSNLFQTDFVTFVLLFVAFAGFLQLIDMLLYLAVFRLIPGWNLVLEQSVLRLPRPQSLVKPPIDEEKKETNSEESDDSIKSNAMSFA